MLPGTQGELEFYGGRLAILGVELYDVTTVVLWRVAPAPRRGALPDERPPVEVDMAGLPDAERARLTSAWRAHRFPDISSRFRVSDDVGTEYAGGGSWHAAGAEEMGRMELRPAPPPAATELIIDAIGVVIRVPLVEGGR